MRITAEGYAFTTGAVTAGAGKPFTIAFRIVDSNTHNVHISKPDGSDVLVPDFFTGPGATVYKVGALKAGIYPFVCDLHPEMTGTLTVK